MIACVELENRTRVGKFNCAKIMSLCPVCERGVNAETDDCAVWIGENWFHKPCSRFAWLARTIILAFDTLTH